MSFIALNSNKRRRSKITIQIEELEKKRKESGDYLEINKNLQIKKSESKENNVLNDSVICEKKYVQFDIYFYFTLNNKEFIFQIKSDFFNKSEQYIYELIKNIVKKINKKNIIINYNNVNYIVSLKDCDNSDDDNEKNFYIKNYEIKYCNKTNFRPLNDIHNLSSNSLIKNINDEKMSLISKTPLNVMLRETIETKIKK